MNKRAIGRPRKPPSNPPCGPECEECIICEGKTHCCYHADKPEHHGCWRWKRGTNRGEPTQRQEKYKEALRSLETFLAKEEKA